MVADLLNGVFRFWISTDWYVALLIGFVANVVTYVGTAFFLSLLSARLSRNNRAGEFLDQRPLPTDQVRREVVYGLMACMVFAVFSLLARVLYNNIWPESVASLLFQVVVFAVVYEAYSYLVHRLLHVGIFRSVHFVHHKSVRVTPWSAYAVHPVEAIFIGASAPLVMLMISMSLSVVFVLHVAGMMFTMLIHSNFRLNRGGWVAAVINPYTSGHALHHKNGRVNYGFVSSALDKLFGTKGEI